MKIVNAILAAALLATSTAFSAEPVTPPSHTAPAVPPAMNAPENPAGDVKGSLKLPRVYFVEPKDGATVTSPLKVKFAVEGMKVAKGKVQGAGTGHFHLAIDSTPVAKGATFPMNDKHVHLAGGESETTVKLLKGEHTLILQFGDNAHTAYGEMLSQTIHITVK